MLAEAEGVAQVFSGCGREVPLKHLDARQGA